MRMSAPSLVRRAHSNHQQSSSSSLPPSLDTCASSTLQHAGERYHHSLHHHGDFHTTASAAITARRSFFSSSWNLLFIKSKKTCTTSTTGRTFSNSTSFHYWLTLCIVFLMLNLISMGKISTSPSFRRAHSSSSSSNSLFSTYSYYTHSNHNDLRSHIQMPHSILLFSGHLYDNSTSLPRPISQVSSSSSLVLPTQKVLFMNKTADFGLLEIEMLPKSKLQRSIQNETVEQQAAMDDDMEDRIARFMTGWDDDSSDEQRVPVLGRDKNLSNGIMTSIKDVQQQQQKDCQRVSWHKTVYPNCNTFHEFDLATVLLDETSAYIGGGSYRQVYLVETKPDPVIIKVMGLDDSYIGIRSVGEFLMDGVVGAAVSKNPSLTDMYGFCSLSMFSEVVWGGSIEDQVMPRGRCSKTVERMLNRTRTGPVESMNNLTSTQKLEWAYMMTQSVAALHQHPEGSIVHSDIALRQFLVTDDGKQIKLTDFNQAQILRYDTYTNQTCDYISMHDYGSHRAPEVYMRKPVQGKIDVWSLGGCFYSLLTGLRTYYDECDEGRHAVPKKVIKGVQYTIDDRWRNHSYAESILVQAIEECSIYDPAQRITIESLLKLLGNAVKKIRRRKRKQPPKAKLRAATAAIDSK